jgi:hypothetical protein
MATATNAASSANGSASSANNSHFATFIAILLQVSAVGGGVPIV